MVRPDISDIEQFSSRARFAGFNETDYLNALEKVPTLTPAQLDDTLGSLQRLAGMLSDMGLSRKNRMEGKPRAYDAKAVKIPRIQKAAARRNGGAGGRKKKP